MRNLLCTASRMSPGCECSKLLTGVEESQSEPVTLLELRANGSEEEEEPLAGSQVLAVAAERGGQVRGCFVCALCARPAIWPAAAGLLPSAASAFVSLQQRPGEPRRAAFGPSRSPAVAVGRAFLLVPLHWQVWFGKRCVFQ